MKTEEVQVLERQKQLARLALDDLFFFNQYILNNAEVMSERLHREMCDFVTNYRQFAGGKKKKLLLEPRFTLKSTCVTVAYPLQQILKNPNIRILVASEKLTNAKTFLASIKGHIEQNPRYRDLAKLIYGRTPMPTSKKEERWTQTEIASVLRTNKALKEPTISTGGVDVVKVGQHYDLIIIDDPVSENNTTTREQMEKVINFYKLCLSLLDPGGHLIIIGTRWDYGDLYGYLIENQQEFFDVLIRSAHLPDGSLIYPEKLTEEFLYEQKVSQGPYIYSCQYENNPVPREDATFKWDHLREWTGQPGVEHKLFIEEMRQYKGETQYDVIEKSTTLIVNYFLTVDPAISEKEFADPTAMVVVAVDDANRMFVVEYVNKKMQGQEFFDELFRLVTTYNPRRVGIETVAYQKSLLYNARDEMRRRNIFFTIDELKPDTDKIRRIQSLQPRYEAGQIYIKAGMDELKYQMVNFPRTVHDDIIDALAYQLQVVYPRKSRDSEEERDRRRAQSSSYRSDITRY